MWCSEKKLYCYKFYCDGSCNEISNGYSQFAYECPDCHGKFNYASIKQGITEEGTTVSGIGRLNYICPFCGREMKGL